MKAIILNEFGGVENLLMAEIPIPAILNDEVLIKVRAISINPVDTRTRSGIGMATHLQHAWQLLKHYARVKPGKKILILAASGGVGHYAVQIAKYLGAYVIAVSSEKNRDFVLSLGADRHIAYDNENFEEVLADEVDIVIDAFSKESLARSLKAVKPNGVILSLLPMIPEEIIAKAREKGVDIHYQLVSSNGDDMRSIAELLAKGIIRSHVSAIFPFEKMADAHLKTESGKTVGKNIVRVF